MRSATLSATPKAGRPVQTATFMPASRARCAASHTHWRTWPSAPMTVPSRSRTTSGITPRGPRPWLGRTPSRRRHRQTQLGELLGSEGRGGAGERVLAALALGEGDGVADGGGARQQHDHAVEPPGDAAVGRHAVGERVEEEPEAPPGLLRPDADGGEHALLYVLPVDAQRSAAHLVAVQDEVVGVGAHGPRVGLEEVEVLVVRPGER